MTRSRPSLLIVLLLALVATALALGTASERSGGRNRDLLDVKRLGGSGGGVLQIDELGVSTSISSHSFGVTNSGTIGGGGGGAGKAQFSALTVRKAIDNSSPVLMSAVATGIHASEAVVTVFKPGTTRALGVYDLDNVIVTAVEQTGAKKNAEAVSLNFGRVTFTAGGSSMCFDLVGNISC
jgi:type VI secretion system secreted protein Hcp